MEQIAAKAAAKAPRQEAVGKKAANTGDIVTEAWVWKKGAGSRAARNAGTEGAGIWYTTAKSRKAWAVIAVKRCMKISRRAKAAHQAATAASIKVEAASIRAAAAAKSKSCSDGNRRTN